MSSPLLEVLPPEPGAEDDSDGQSVYVSVSISEADGTLRSASSSLPADATNEAMARGLVDSLLGVARGHSLNLYYAVINRMRRELS